MSIKEYPFKTTASRIVWSCPWYQVRQDEIITPDGRPGIYNVIEKADAVWIVPVTTDGRVAMSRQYRYTVVQVIGAGHNYSGNTRTLQTNTTTSTRTY